MTPLVIGLILGLPVGWYLRTAYQRLIWETIVKLRRQMRGGSRRRTRRR